MYISIYNTYIYKVHEEVKSDKQSSLKEFPITTVPY